MNNEIEERISSCIRSISLSITGIYLRNGQILHVSNDLKAYDLWLPFVYNNLTAWKAARQKAIDVFLMINGEWDNITRKRSFILGQIQEAA